jgi:hypothetical protein
MNMFLTGLAGGYEYLFLRETLPWMVALHSLPRASLCKLDCGNHTDVAIAEFEKERSSNPLEGGIYNRLGDAYYRFVERQPIDRETRHCDETDDTCGDLGRWAIRSQWR